MKKYKSHMKKDAKEKALQSTKFISFKSNG